MAFTSGSIVRMAPHLRVLAPPKPRRHSSLQRLSHGSCYCQKISEVTCPVSTRPEWGAQEGLLSNFFKTLRKGQRPDNVLGGQRPSKCRWYGDAQRFSHLRISVLCPGVSHSTRCLRLLSLSQLEASAPKAVWIGSGRGREHTDSCVLFGTCLVETGLDEGISKRPCDSSDHRNPGTARVRPRYHNFRTALQQYHQASWPYTWRDLSCSWMLQRRRSSSKFRVLRTHVSQCGQSKVFGWRHARSCQLWKFIHGRDKSLETEQTISDGRSRWISTHGHVGELPGRADE